MSIFNSKSKELWPSMQSAALSKDHGLETLAKIKKDNLKGVYEETPRKSNVTNQIAMRQASVDQLRAGILQPRTNFNGLHLAELAESIKQSGIIQPLIVRKIKGDLLEIVAGERRWRAAKLAGLKQVPVIMRTLSDQEALGIALIENVQRQDLNPIEEAGGYQKLISEFSYTQDKLSELVGRSRSHVNNMIRILALPQDVLDMLQKGTLSAGHARALLGTTDPYKLAQHIEQHDFSVRQTEQLVKDLEGKVDDNSIAHASRENSGLVEMAKVLSKTLQTKVTLTKNKLSIYYKDEQELDGILDGITSRLSGTKSLKTILEEDANGY